MKPRKPYIIKAEERGHRERIKPGEPTKGIFLSINQTLYDQIANPKQKTIRLLIRAGLKLGTNKPATASRDYK